MHPSQRLINHVALVLDGSSSMQAHQSRVIKVADEQIKHLALRSEELSQETRVSVYLFSYSYRVECLIFDMDVMRLPSIAELYRAEGMTALIDATLKSQADLETTSQIYGDHAFLTFVLTDGMENDSRNTNITLARKLQNLPENWTVGFLVPNSQGVAYLDRVGVPKGNIAQWDAASATGMIDAGSKIRTATDNFMEARTRGVRGTRDVFSTGPEAVNKVTVSSALEPMKERHAIVPIPATSRIDEFVRGTGREYKIGMGYYQLTKTETIQAQKKIVVVDKRTQVAYTGNEARHLIGLPDGQSVRVRPDRNPDYKIFVQSTSVNRKLLPGTDLLIVGG